MTSNLSGISKGRFSLLHFLRNGSYQDINTVLNNTVASISAGSNIAIGGTTSEPVVNALLDGYVTDAELATALLHYLLKARYQSFGQVNCLQEPWWQVMASVLQVAAAPP